MAEGRNPSDEFELLSCDSDSDENGGKSKVGWIVDKGLSVGKTLAITGCVISSAPVILPPLVVISALGFAASVPFGFLYVSYAFTETFMRKLLPPRVIVPPSLLMIGYAADDQYLSPYESEEETEIEERLESKSPSFYIEGARDDTKSVESVAQEMESYGTSAENRESTEEQNVTLIPATIGGVTSGVESEFAHEKDVMNGKTPESESLKLEEISGTEKETAEEEKQQAASFKEKEGGRREKKKAFTKLHFTGKKKPPVVEQTTIEVSNGEEGKSSEEREEASSEIVEEEKARQRKEGSVQNEIAVAEEEAKKAKLRESSEEREEASSEIVDAEKARQTKEGSVQNGNAVAEEEAEKAKLQESVGSDARNKKDEGDQQTPFPGSNGQSRIIADDSKHSSKEAALTDIQEPRYDANLNLKEKNDSKSAEGRFEPDKIWVQIDAIRAIMGMEAPRNSSYVDELKALYSFTGIEFPESFMDPPTPSEFYDKLRFLMTVIGVK